MYRMCNSERVGEVHFMYFLKSVMYTKSSLSGTRFLVWPSFFLVSCPCTKNFTFSVNIQTLRASNYNVLMILLLYPAVDRKPQDKGTTLMP